MYSFSKRLLDFAVALSLLSISIPLFFLISLLIKCTSKGPIFYEGKRAGLNGVPFSMYKFRTMVPNSDISGGFSTALNDPRLTSCGRFLRRSKLDELPQLINVLRGEMSLVGPRPQVFFYTDKYTNKEQKILLVKPGITDLASVYFADMDAVLGSGDVDTKYQIEIEPKKNELRLLYVNKASFFFDLKILFLTVAKMLKFPISPSNFEK